MKDAIQSSSQFEIEEFESRAFDSASKFYDEGFKAGVINSMNIAQSCSDSMVDGKMREGANIVKVEICLKLNPIKDQPNCGG